MPTRKVVVGLLATQITAVGVFVLGYFDPKVMIPAAIAVSLAGIVSTVLQYVIPEKDQA